MFVVRKTQKMVERRRVIFVSTESMGIRPDGKLNPFPPSTAFIQSPCNHQSQPLQFQNTTENFIYLASKTYHKTPSYVKSPDNLLSPRNMPSFPPFTDKSRRKKISPSHKSNPPKKTRTRKKTFKIIMKNKKKRKRPKTPKETRPQTMKSPPNSRLSQIRAPSPWHPKSIRRLKTIPSA